MCATISPLTDAFLTHYSTIRNSTLISPGSLPLSPPLTGCWLLRSCSHALFKDLTFPSLIKQRKKNEQNGGLLTHFQAETHGREKDGTKVFGVTNVLTCSSPTLTDKLKRPSTSRQTSSRRANEREAENAGLGQPWRDSYGVLLQILEDKCPKQSNS